MFNFRESLTYIFKEKNWFGKLAIPFVLQFILILITFSFGLLDSSNLSRSKDMQALLAGGSLLICCVMCIFYVVYIVITSWYNYEYTQRAIFDRKSQGIWQENFVDLIKKFGKSVLVAFVYSIPVLILSCILYFTFATFFLTIAGTSFSYGGVNTIEDSRAIATAFSGLGAGFILFLCILCCFTLVITAYQYLVIFPALLRLYYTNTFTEAFNLRYNFYIVRKYMADFFKLFAIVIVFVIIYIILAIVIGLLSAILMVVPFVGTVFSVITYVVSIVITTYFAAFVLPYLSGTMYRGVMEKEGEKI